jgi:hypothetical protein
MTSRNGESTIPMTATDAPNPAARLTPDDLRRLIAPRSVAIVGASERKGSFGNRAMENLQSFDGPVHLVNAHATSVAATRSRHVLLEPANVRFASKIGIGGRLATPPLPHHRAYGSVPRRFDRVKPAQA